MLIIPAIDIHDGRAVRLIQGDYTRRTVYNEDPAAVARTFVDAGFNRIHVVDLEGAKEGRFRNLGVIGSILESVSVQLQVGGGIRSGVDVRTLLEAGAAKCIVGSVAVGSLELIGEWIDEFGNETIVVAVDIREGYVAHTGWLESSRITPDQLIAGLVRMGLRECIITDISKDGMLAGPNTDLYRAICAAYPDLTVIASGGVSSIEDLHALRETGVRGVVIGKAIYEGKIALDDLGKFEKR
jgi:phosphoribosylformimino-5-aminoimidazole carboxamide ribotide isomerase